MKIIGKASKRSIKMSMSEWTAIGQKAGWIKKAQAVGLQSPEYNIEQMEAKSADKIQKRLGDVFLDLFNHGKLSQTEFNDVMHNLHSDKTRISIADHVAYVMRETGHNRDRAMHHALSRLLVSLLGPAVNRDNALQQTALLPVQARVKK